MMLRVTTKPSERRALANWIVPPPYITNEELRQRGIEARLFKGWPGPVDETGRISPEDEILLFKQLHYCGYRLSKIYKTADKAPSKSLELRYSKWVQRYDRIRARLIEGNIGLVYDLIGRSRFVNLDRDDMTSEGMMALLRAVDTFDPWRGFRFSTYACNAILRAFSRAALQDSKRRNLIVANWEPDYERSNAPEVRRADQQALYMERLRMVLNEDAAELTDLEKSVLERRFPIEQGRKRQTLEDIGRQMRVSKERVRQIQLGAIAKLRRTLADDHVLS